MTAATALGRDPVDTDRHCCSPRQCRNFSTILHAVGRLSHRLQSPRHMGCRVPDTRGAARKGGVTARAVTRALGPDQPAGRFAEPAWRRRASPDGTASTQARLPTGCCVRTTRTQLLPLLWSGARGGLARAPKFVGRTALPRRKPRRLPLVPVFCHVRLSRSRLARRCSDRRDDPALCGALHGRFGGTTPRGGSARSARPRVRHSSRVRSCSCPFFCFACDGSCACSSRFLFLLVAIAAGA